MMKLLSPLTPYLTAIKIAAVILAAIFVYWKGYSAAAASWELKYEQREVEITKAHNAEVSRQAQANAQAKAIEAKRIARLAAENAALEQKIKELSDEADADPDRDRPALSDGSRLRIDSIH